MGSTGRGVVPMLLISVMLTPIYVHADNSMSEIVDNVRMNEKLYENLVVLSA
jgi:hypothetical protein